MGFKGPGHRQELHLAIGLGTAMGEGVERYPLKSASDYWRGLQVRVTLERGEF
ncbi:MAG: hypothetical protein HC860_16265 [Alkalinema sp. RU_4_3]|nr:hypothetical protein [Alkalinema sp. RU_4_3]